MLKMIRIYRCIHRKKSSN